MLSDKIYECVKLIDEVQANKDQNDNNNKVAQTNNGFFDAYYKFFKPLMESYQVVKLLPEFKFPSELTTKLSSQIKNTEKTLKEKHVTNPSGYRASLHELNDSFSSEWKKMLEMYDSELFGGLTILKPLQTSKEITQILNVLNGFKDWPINKANIETYKTARQKGEKILSEMQFDDEIKDFLQKVSLRKATLSDLTDRVVAWIKNEHLENRFGISVYSSLN